LGGVSFGCLGSGTRVLLDTTRFLLVKSFRLPHDSASTGVAATVEILNQIIGSARSSGTHIYRIVSGSFVFSYSVPPGTPQYGIYSDRTVIGRWRRIDLHPKWFVAYKDTRAMYDPRSYELNSTHPSVYGHPPPTTPLSLSFAPPRPTTPNSPECPYHRGQGSSVVGKDLPKLGTKWRWRCEMRGIGCIQGMHAFIRSLYAALLTAFYI